MQCENQYGRFDFPEQSVIVMIRTAAIAFITAFAAASATASRPAVSSGELSLPVVIEVPRSGVFSLIPPIESSFPSVFTTEETPSALDCILQEEMAAGIVVAPKDQVLLTAPVSQAMSTGNSALL